jgi:hypothetical protein
MSILNNTDVASYLLPPRLNCETINSNNSGPCFLLTTRLPKLIRKTRPIISAQKDTIVKRKIATKVTYSKNRTQYENRVVIDKIAIPFL